MLIECRHLVVEYNNSAIPSKHYEQILSTHATHNCAEKHTAAYIMHKNILNPHKYKNTYSVHSTKSTGIVVINSGSVMSRDIGTERRHREHFTTLELNLDFSHHSF